MEKSIKPDRKYFTVCNYIMLTISGLTIIGLAIFHLIMFLAGGESEVILGFWIVGAALNIAMWAISYPILVLWIKNLEYIIREDRITIHKGIISKTQQNIPYRSITDFALRRGLFDRMIGIGSISIQTAGQSHSADGYEGTLKGLLDYDELQTELREKLKSMHPVSEATANLEAVPASESNVLLKILEELKEIRINTEK